MSLTTPTSNDEWLADGAPDVLSLAGKRVVAMERTGASTAGVQSLDERARRGLDLAPGSAAGR